MALTFIHTSDWHLGREYRRIGPRSAETWKWRFDAVRSIQRLAIESQAAFIVVAGDVFDRDLPNKKTVDEAIALLRDMPVPAILISGNHDPCLEGSVWRHLQSALAGATNIRIALDSEPIVMESHNVTIFPCPIFSKRYPGDVTAQIPVGTRGQGFRIGVAHGMWQGYFGKEQFENLIVADRTERSGLDYLAMGDFHSHTLPEYPAAQARAWYSGTPECTAADEARPGFALRVTISAPGANPEVEPVRVGRLRPVVVPGVSFSTGQTIDALVDSVQEVAEPASVLLNLTVAGSLSRPEFARFQAWRNGLVDQFLGVEISDERLTAEPTAADFDTLGLDESEREILDLLTDGACEALLQSHLGSSLLPEVAALARSPDARRSALDLYFQMLKSKSENAA